MSCTYVHARMKLITINLQCAKTYHLAKNKGIAVHTYFDLGHGCGSGLDTPNIWWVANKKVFLATNSTPPSSGSPDVSWPSNRPQVLGKIFQTHGEQQDELLWSRFAEVWEGTAGVPIPKCWAWNLAYFGILWPYPPWWPCRFFNVSQVSQLSPSVSLNPHEIRCRWWLSNVTKWGLRPAAFCFRWLPLGPIILGA